MEYLLCSPGAIEVGYLPVGVVQKLGNRIVGVGTELAADEKLEYSVDSL